MSAIVMSTEMSADPASVRAARQAVADLIVNSGGGEDLAERARLAVSEAATNVVVHAYSPEQPGRFRLLAVTGEDETLVVIDDDGCGLSAPVRNAGLGMGLTLMDTMATAAFVRERRDGGTTVQLRFA